MMAARRMLLALVCGVVMLGAVPRPAMGAAAAGAAPAQEPYQQLPLRRDSDGSGASAWMWLALLAGAGIVLVLVAAKSRRSGHAWPPPALARWAARHPRPARIQVIERRGLHAGCTLYLVRWDDEEVLLGCTSQTVSLIGRRAASQGQQTGES